MTSSTLDLQKMHANVPEHVHITLRVEWESGERFELTLDGPRGEWEPGELFEVARRAGEAANIISESVTVLDVVLRWPYAVGAGVLLD